MRDREKQAAWHRRNRQQKQAVVDALKAAGCADCGEADSVVLEFHHRDPATKRQKIGTLVAAHYPVQRLLEELAKCALLCANCHLRRHSK